MECNWYLLVNGVKIYQFKVKDSKINSYPLQLANISSDFTVDNMKKLGYVDTYMIFQLIKPVFIIRLCLGGLLTTECLSLNSEHIRLNQHLLIYTLMNLFIIHL